MRVVDAAAQRFEAAGFRHYFGYVLKPGDE